MRRMNEEVVIMVAPVESNPTLICKEWCNTGMPKQLTWIFMVDTSLPEDEQVLGNAVGDIFAVNHDASLGFRHHKTRSHSVVNVMNSTLYFDNQEEFECDDEGEIVDVFVNIDHETLAHIFMTKVNDLYNYSYCDCNEVIDQMRQFSKDNNLNLVFREEYCAEEYCNTWMCYTQEFADKAHINEDVVYAFSLEVAKEVCREENRHSSFEFEEMIEMYPDGYNKDYAIVCYR